ncbi:MAG: helix-hairpin-helix domain-containing protein [Flavobacteriales bacterium]|nr:helix-hairpin-helix domain-containing protein [Flavobacteriales bacterium]MCL4280963.1 helix-hairpin-helix domain-containing protein [Flavobacteriales bacterium]
MMRGLLLAALLAVCAFMPLRAQVAPPELRDLIEERLAVVAEQLGDDSDVDLSELADRMMDHFNDPIDLNRATAEDLASLYLLSDIEINAIRDHIRLYGPYISIYELQTVDGLSQATLELVRPFLTVRAEGSSRTPLKVMLQNGSHELLFRSQVNIEQRRGFLGRDPFGLPYTYPNGSPLPDVDDPAVMDSLRLNNKVYLGSPWKLYTRYRFKYRRNISFGITAEKDEGEEFLKGTRTDGFDFYSAHLFLRDIGPFKAVALGDFQAQFGQGLVFSSGLAYSRKSAYTMNITRNAEGLTPYASVNENQFLRGAGATMGLGKHWEATAFISRKGYDANVVEAADTAYGGGGDADLVSFSSFQEDGYHRTHTELAKKNAIEEFIYGGHLKYRGKGWEAGITAAQVEFGHALSKTRVYPYNQFDFQGKRNTTYGFNWNVPYRNVTWFGEAARSANGGMAGLTGLMAALDKRFAVAMLYRDLQRDFHGLYSSAFSEGTNPWNERGLYTGIEIKPNRQWVFNAYFDQFAFPWLRFQTDGLSNGSEVLGQLTWTPKRGFQLYVKARHQNKPRNTGESLPGVPPLVGTRQENYRFNASYRVSDGVTLRTRVERVDYRRGEEPLERGFMLYQDVIHRPKRGRVEYTGRIMVFATDSYDARIYAYESDVPGVFGLPPIYGRGMKWYTMLRWSVARHVDIWARYGITVYTDRTVIGSGMQEIHGDQKSDLKLEMRLKF